MRDRAHCPVKLATARNNVIPMRAFERSSGPTVESTENRVRPWRKEPSVWLLVAGIVLTWVATTAVLLVILK